MSGDQFVFVNVERKDVGDVDMEFDSGETYSGEALVLTCLMLNVETAQRETITLVVPKSTGIDLVRNLLTEDQFEAAMDASL